MNRKKFQEYHLEVVETLTAIGNPALGNAIQLDRGSQLKHLGIRFPELRRKVKEGFSFYKLRRTGTRGLGRSMADISLW